MALSKMLLFQENGDMFEIVISTMLVFPMKILQKWRQISASHGWSYWIIEYGGDYSNILRSWFQKSEVHNNIDFNNVSISLEILYIVKKDICVTWAELFEKRL